MTHPFHPQSGKLLPCVGKRGNRHGKRVLLRGEGGTVWSVPLQWTDLVAPDPEVIIGGGRTLFRMADLLELAELVERLLQKTGPSRATKCKAIFAADVKPIPLQGE